jgi:hypothetical protein
MCIAEVDLAGLASSMRGRRSGSAARKLQVDVLLGVGPDRVWYYII